jgi:hypothetical protein
VAVGVGVSAGSSVTVGIDVDDGNGVGVDTVANAETAIIVGVTVAVAGVVITGSAILVGIVGLLSIDGPIQPPIIRNIIAIEVDNIIRPTSATSTGNLHLCY